jgi:hypothetical protein
MQPPSNQNRPPSEGRIIGLISAVKGMTLTNVAVIAILAVIAMPMYVIWRALGDEKIMDRLLSTYEEISNQQSGCTLRHVQQRGGEELWGISTGFAFQGADRWFVNVVLTHQPTDAELLSYCESLKLIADRMRQP